ncbi:hypothetical protein Vqi01_07640 [Micromonospora qiuiae]|uniref:Uncharacterized protein n=1 Tax=Micromonospora qiuiae TaxID=502268 RepID=A0ABQ4J609_9ACTN|nr:hypothetical protein Vqi01_07640 [Micromonospora qiuiae]
MTDLALVSVGDENGGPIGPPRTDGPATHLPPQPSSQYGTRADTAPDQHFHSGREESEAPAKAKCNV